METRSSTEFDSVLLNSNSEELERPETDQYPRHGKKMSWLHEAAPMLVGAVLGGIFSLVSIVWMVIAS